jgi:hypothetical protein
MTRKTRVAVAIWVSAWLVLVLLPAHDVAAQERSRSPSPERLWKAYPLAPTVEPGTQPKQTSSPAASVVTDRRPVGTARAGTDGGTSVFVLALLAFVAAGGMLTFAGIRRRRASEPTATAVPLSSKLAEAAHPVPAARSRGPSGRFSRPAAKPTARSTATATVAATQRPDSGGPGAADDPHRREVPSPPATAEASPMTPVVTPAPAGSPPDPRLTWTAEIEWRRIDGESRFCVIARGAGTVEVAQSPPLDWPPDGPAALQAVTDAADKLAATLVAAGWKPQPPGNAWYAKRFTWEPEPEPAKGSKAAPRRFAGAKPAGPPRPETLRPTSDERGAPERVPSKHSRAKQVVLLGVLAVVGLIAALQLGGGSDSSAGRSTPHESIDLSVPLLGIVGVLLLVVLIRQIRRALR